ncbi:hypothetical protein BK809_0000271 [Diplodia seriata]|uniref:T6SS Phospholipase effector Tle1-like catalytic domain-containing protein n=1 Tax=Diplodia seriata TaxID=420778 RepID=A0A1S8BCW3_9PEZI|nr:hypothetical protein BK809_0000271 [Diplodia seriata]
MKRLIICCDGTWNSADKGRDSVPSNVALISRMIAPHGTGKTPGEIVEQVVYYQTGIGAGPSSHLDSIWQGATGAGLEENVTTAYHYLANNYIGDKDGQAADEIFLFGFSRGAYTARSLAGMVTEMGLLRPEELLHFPDLYKVYRAHGNAAPSMRAQRDAVGGEGAHNHRVAGDVAHGNEATGSSTHKDHEHIKHTGKFWKSAKKTANGIDKKMWDKIKRFHPNNNDNNKNSHSPINHEVRIKAIGVWDTVGSRGLPENWFTRVTGWNASYHFHDTALNRKVDHAFHALSLDEHRGAFQPTMWYLDHSDPDYGASTDLKQCWFPGFHADVGGGITNNTSDSTSDIDEISLAWMCDQVDGLVQFDKYACDALLLFKEGPKGERKVPSKWAEGCTNDSSFWYKLPIVGGDVFRTPGQYKKNLRNDTCFGGNGDFVTNETVHPSAHHRMEEIQGYLPRALKSQSGWFKSKGQMWDFVPKSEDDPGKGAQWVRHHGSAVRGWLSGNVDGERKVRLDEWWIRESQESGRLNFEWNLLTSELRDKLKKRNEHRSEQEFEYCCRNKYGGLAKGRHQKRDSALGTSE